MTAKELISKAFYLYNNNDAKYGKEFTDTEVYKQCIVMTDLLDTIQCKHIPEVTKIICHNKSLMDKYSTEEINYNYVSPLFVDELSIDKCISYVKSRSQEDLKSVLVFFDNKIVNAFLNAYDTVYNESRETEKLIRDLDAEIYKLEEKMMNYNKQLENLDKNGKKVNNTDNLNPEEVKKLSQKRISVKGNITKNSNNLEAKQKEKEILKKKLRANEEFLKKDCFFEEVKRLKCSVDEKIDQNRREALKICSAMNQFEEIVKKVHSNVVLNETDLKYMSGEKFKTDLDLYFKELSTNEIKLVDILLRDLYICIVNTEDSVDMNIQAYLKSHMDWVCDFFVRHYTYGDDYGCDNEDETCQLWLEFIFNSISIDNALFTGSHIYSSFWDGFKSKASISWLIKQLTAKINISFEEMLCRFFMVTDISIHKLLYSMLKEDIDSKKISITGLSKILLVDCNGYDNNANIDLAFQLIEEFENECSRKVERLQRDRDKSERRLILMENRHSSEAYSTFNEQLERLEKLAIELDPGKITKNKETVEYRYVETKKYELKNIIANIRKSLEEVYNVKPCVDINTWKSEKTVEFNPKIHTLDSDVKPQKVKLVTMGFIYRDEESGEFISEPKRAVVSDVNKINTDTLSAKGIKGTPINNQYKINSSENINKNFKKKKYKN